MKARIGGFTLAEVLITLTIIGVIAAITIPNLVQSYKKHEVEVKIKTAYSIIYNAVQIAEKELGPTEEWNYSDATSDLFITHLMPYIKISKDCSNTINNNPAHCFCYTKALNGELAGYIGGRSAIMANGMSIAMRPNIFSAHVYIDIDGPQKGSCMLGKDIFTFSINNKYALKTNFTVSPGTTIAWSDPYKTQSINQLLSTERGGCNKEATGSAEVQPGSFCAAAIAKNNWKLPDNYPVKKF